MQAGHDMFAAASSTLSSKASSFRHFSRLGAMVIGIAAGITVSANAVSAREGSFRKVISERDEKIAELTAANQALSNTDTSSSVKPSSGDDVQDWIDSLPQ